MSCDVTLKASQPSAARATEVFLLQRIDAGILEDHQRRIFAAAASGHRQIALGLRIERVQRHHGQRDLGVLGFHRRQARIDRHGAQSRQLGVPELPKVGGAGRAGPDVAYGHRRGGADRGLHRTRHIGRRAIRRRHRTQHQRDQAGPAERAFHQAAPLERSSAPDESTARLFSPTS